MALSSPFRKHFTNMGKVYDLNSYRFYHNVRQMLHKDGIRCSFKFTAEKFIELTTKYSAGKMAWGDYYMEVASHAMTINAGTVG